MNRRQFLVASILGVITRRFDLGGSSPTAEEPPPSALSWTTSTWYIDPPSQTSLINPRHCDSSGSLPPGEAVYRMLQDRWGR